MKVFLFAGMAAFASAANGDEQWPSFRGPSGTGISADEAAPLVWGEKENVRWRTPLPDRGNSTPVVWGDRVFVTQAVEADKKRSLIAFDSTTGNRLWISSVDAPTKEPTNSQNPYCSASPATDGARVVAFYGSPGLYCYDYSGKKIWHRSFGEVDSWHGSGSSPILHDGLCYLNFGPGTKSALYALDAKTGEVAWKVEPTKQTSGRAPMFPPRGPGGPPRGMRPGPPDGSTKKEEAPSKFESAGRSGDFSGKGGFNGSWSTPVVIRSGDKDQLLVVESSRVAAYEPKTGKLLWSCGGLPMQVFASPAVGEDVVVATGHNIPSGTKVMAVRLGGSGDVTTTHKLWEVDLKKECIGSPVIANGCLFLVTEAGFGVCLDLKTGKQLWQDRLQGGGGSWSSIVLVGGRLVVANQSGNVCVLTATPEFKVLRRNIIPTETTCSSPAVSQGKVFLRTHSALWCFGATPAE